MKVRFPYHFITFAFILFILPQTSGFIVIDGKKPHQRSTRLAVINVKQEFTAKLSLGLLGWANEQPIVQGELSIRLTSVYPAGKSQLVTVTLPLPLGIELEQSDDGVVRVTGVSGAGSVDGDNIRVGDILRALTARQKKMAYPQGQVALGGIGRPQLVTSLIVCERSLNLSYFLDGISSNNLTADSHPDPMMLKPGSPTLLLERAF